MPSQIFVTIPYEDLTALLEAVRQVPAILEQNKRILAECDATRCLFSECLQKFAELKDFVMD